MPAPLNPNLWPSVLHDQDGIPISPSNPLPVTGGGGGGVTNQPNLTTFRITIGATPATGVQGPSVAIPNGVAVLIRASLDNQGRIFVGGTQAEAEDQTTASELDPGDAIWYFVTNATAIWISGEFQDDNVRCTVEVA